MTSGLRPAGVAAVDGPFLLATSLSPAGTDPIPCRHRHTRRRPLLASNRPRQERSAARVYRRPSRRTPSLTRTPPTSPRPPTPPPLALPSAPSLSTASTGGDAVAAAAACPPQSAVGPTSYGSMCTTGSRRCWLSRGSGLSTAGRPSTRRAADDPKSNTTQQHLRKVARVARSFLQRAS